MVNFDIMPKEYDPMTQMAKAQHFVKSYATLCLCLCQLIVGRR